MIRYRNFKTLCSYVCGEFIRFYLTTGCDQIRYTHSQITEDCRTIHADWTPMTVRFCCCHSMTGSIVWTRSCRWCGRGWASIRISKGASRRSRTTRATVIGSPAGWRPTRGDGRLCGDDGPQSGALDIRRVGRSRIRNMRKRVIVIVIAALAVLGLIATMLGGVPA